MTTTTKTTTTTTTKQTKANALRGASGSAMAFAASCVLCACDGGGDSTIVAGAELRDVELTTLCAAMGGEWGGATLRIARDSGVEEDIPVRIGAGVVCVPMDISHDSDLLFADGSFTLPPEATLDDVLGDYTGAGIQLHLGVGGRGEELTHESSGAKLTLTASGLGFGMMIDLKWLWLGAT